MVRIVILGSATMLLAGGAHVAGGGQLPGVGLLAVLALLTGTLSVMVTARRCQFRFLAAVIAVQQLLLHEIVTAAAGAQGPGAACATSLAGHAAHVSPAGLACSAPVAHISAGADGSALISMLVLHGLATVLTAWLLARGEAWLWAMAERAAEILSAVIAGGLPDLGARSAVGYRAVPYAPAPLGTGCARGPPLSSG